MTTYTHNKKKGNYIILFPCEMQIDDIWIEAVCYKSLDSGKIYCRAEDDFNIKFLEV